MFGAAFASVKPFGARIFAGTMARSVQEMFCALIISALLLYIAPVDGNMLDLCKNGHTKPLGDIKLEYGKVPLIITCVITSASKIAANPNISNIMFYTKAGAEVQNMTRILNSTSIQLYDEHPLKSNELYTCKLRGSGKGKDESICWNDVSIGVKPYNVSDFKCISNNFENLTCSWTPLNTFVDTIYELTFHYGAKNIVINNCPKLEYPSEYQPESKKIRCVLDMTTDPQYRLVLPIYYFKLRMYNDFGEYINPTYDFHHFKNVRSGPPERLEAINTTTSSIYLNWSIPNSMVTFPKPLQYRVVYQCEYGPKKWLPGGEMTVQKHDAVYYYNLTGLANAHALCDIRVAIRSAEARDDESMWSAHASITVRTSSRLPGAPPNTTIGSFEISFSEIETVTDITKNEVYIYWQQIGDDIKNGEEFHYETVVLENDAQQRGGPIERKEQSNAYAKYGNLVLSGTYRFAVYSVNSQGRSVRRSEIVVPAQALRPKEPGSFTKVSYGNGKYELKWEPAAHGKGTNRPALTGYTLFWCSNDRDRPYQCSGHLDWVHLAANVTSHQLTVVEKKQITQFAITANTGNTSSGMLWASCTILHDRYVGKIRDFWINNMGSTHIEVGWKLACSERIGNVIGYTIFYCPIISPKETDCKGDVQIQSIEGDENLIHGRIAGLIPYTTYMLRIAVVTAVQTAPAAPGSSAATAARPPPPSLPPSNKTSQLSDALYNTTLEAAPTPPLHLTLLNVTNASVAFIWDAPAHSNGVLKYYKVMYNGKTDEVGPGTEKTKRTFELKSLQSFVTYNITVSACTTFCSKPSDMVRVTTRIGLPGTISSIDTRFQNDSYVLVNWPLPNPPRGRCDYYQLNIKHEIDYKNETLPITNVTERKYAVTRCGDNNRYNTFYMSVRAVNLINGVPFRGPWSDEIKFFCKAPPSSIFWLVFSSVMAVFVALLLWLSRRCYYHYRDMRNVEVKLPPGLATAAISDCNLPSWSSDGGIPGKANMNANLATINNRCDSTAHIPMHYQHNVFGAKDKDHHNLSNQQQIVKSDEELVLLKMNSRESDRSSSGDSSGCSTGQNSATSLEGSAADGRDDDDIDIAANTYGAGGDGAAPNAELNRRNADRCSSDSGTDQANSNSTNSLNKTNSLRLRKSIPTGSMATTATGGYITMPPDLAAMDAQSAGQTLWSVVTKPTSPVNTYCMLGIDPAAAAAAAAATPNSTNNQQHIVGAPLSAYVAFDSHQQQQQQSNRGTASPDHQQQHIAPVVLSRPTLITAQGMKSAAAAAVSAAGYIPLMYGDPSDTENDILATTPPASHANFAQPPNYVLASAKQPTTPTSIPIQIATLMKPQLQLQLQHQHDFVPSLIAVNTANVTNDKVIVYKGSIEQASPPPPPYVQAAPMMMAQSKLHPTVALQSIAIDCQMGQDHTMSGVTSPGYVSVADVNPPTKRQEQPSQTTNATMGYIAHRQLSSKRD